MFSVQLWHGRETVPQLRPCQLVLWHGLPTVPAQDRRKVSTDSSGNLRSAPVREAQETVPQLNAEN